MACECAGKMAEFDERLETVTVLLSGNGRPDRGLVVRMQRSEDAMAIMATQVKEIRDSARHLFWAVLIAVFGALGTIAANAVAAHWR